jgi:hypothetical protein
MDDGDDHNDTWRDNQAEVDEWEKDPKNWRFIRSDDTHNYYETRSESQPPNEYRFNETTGQWEGLIYDKYVIRAEEHHRNSQKKGCFSCCLFWK